MPLKLEKSGGFRPIFLNGGIFVKRSFTALMAAVLVLALCACGTDAPAETVPPATPEATASPTPVPTVAVEIPAPEPEDTALVRVRDYIPDIWVDLR